MYFIEAPMTFVGWVMYFLHMRERGKADFRKLSKVYRAAADFAHKHSETFIRIYAHGQMCSLAWNFVKNYPNIEAPKMPENMASRPPRDSLICRIEFIGHVFRQGDLRYRGKTRQRLPELLEHAIWFSVAQFALIQRYRRTGDLSEIAYEYFHAFPKPMLLSAPNEHFMRGMPKETDNRLRREYEDNIRSMSDEEFDAHISSLSEMPRPKGGLNELALHHKTRALMLRGMSDTELAEFRARFAELERQNEELERRNPRLSGGPRFRATKRSSWEEMRVVYFTPPVRHAKKPAA